jgi:hypothetical protein
MVFGKILSWVLDRIADAVEGLDSQAWNGDARAGPDGWDEVEMQRIARF